MNAPVFVFGSNLLGIHGAGAALHARRCHAASPGIGEGATGSAYALPTKKTPRETLPLMTIRGHVERFAAYADAHPETEFFVTRVGCGLAGHTDAEIAPMFEDAPTNCVFPPEWVKMLGYRYRYHSGACPCGNP